MAAESSGAVPACLEGKGPGERAAILHQHLGRREMTDIIIETIQPRAGTGTGGKFGGRKAGVPTLVAIGGDGKEGGGSDGWRRAPFGGAQRREGGRMGTKWSRGSARQTLRAAELELPKEVAECPLEVLKTYLGVFLCSLQ